MNYNKLKGSELEDRIGEVLEENNYIVFVRKKFVDITSWRNRLAFCIECKGHDLSRKQQMNAIKVLNRHRSPSIELLSNYSLPIDKVLKILIAPSFSYQSVHAYQYTPNEFVNLVIGNV